MSGLQCQPTKSCTLHSKISLCAWTMPMAACCAVPAVLPHGCAFPSQTSNPILSPPVCLFTPTCLPLWQDLFERWNLTVPNTWQEFVELAMRMNGTGADWILELAGVFLGGLLVHRKAWK